MLRHLRRLDRRILFTSTVLPLCVFASACGGDGGSRVENVPPPPVTPTPTPTPTPGSDLPTGTVTYTYPSTNPVHIRISWLDSPATRAGTTDLLGRLTINPGTGNPADWTVRKTAPGEFTMGVGPISGPNGQYFQYTLNGPAGIIPGAAPTTTAPSPLISWDINSTVAYRYTNPYGDTPQYLGQRLTGENELGAQLFSYDFTRGVTGASQPYGTGTNLHTRLDYDVGLSYVAMGEWSWSIVDVNGVTVAGTPSAKLLFVNGDRTPPSNIPVSGTATYDARTLLMLSSAGTAGIPFTLTADFGLRTIATRIDQDFQNHGTAPDSVPIQGIHVSGSAPFSSDGSFDIPLTGTVNYSYANQTTPPPSEAASGDMNGAFFGPNAEQIGGTFSLQRPGDMTPLIQDAFVGQQHH